MRAPETITSTDGTRIAFWREGSGPPLLLVHGGLCDHLAWYFTVPLLAHSHTVYVFDRRGRGASGDTPPHAVEREWEDIAAMLRLIGQPAHLLGHSAGAILSLAAAGRADSLRSLILYDPPFAIEGGRERPAPSILHRMETLLAAGDRDEALRIAMRETVGMPDSAIEQMRASPGREHLLGAAGAIPHDWAVWQERLEPERLSALQMPVLLLLGTDSPNWIRVSTQAVQAAIPRARIVELAGQGHSATITAPEMFASAVTDFTSSIG